MKLLVVGINYTPEMISTAVYTSGLAEELARHNVQVEVITAKPYYPAWRVFDGWRGPFWRRQTTQGGVRVIHCPLYVPSDPTGIKRILHHISFALTVLPVALWKAMTYRPDVVFAVAPGMVSAPSAWLAAKLAGATTWLHIQDFEVEAAFATGLLKPSSLLGCLALKFEREVLRRFNRVSSISLPMLNKLTKKGVPPEKCYELRNWADLTRISPMPENSSSLKAELGITTRYVALYSGNLANKQGLEIIPKIARSLIDRDDLTIVICGDGPIRETLVRSADGIKNIKFLPLQPIDRLNDLLGMADVHLLPQIADAADLVLPSKLTNMLASGRPIIVTARADSALGQEVDGAGILVEPGDAVAAAEALRHLLQAPDEREALGREARQRAINRWDMGIIIKRLRHEFAILVGDTPRETNQVSTTKDEA